MHQRGLLDTTLVIALGEFGRTPKINKDTGRDHWSNAMSVLFAGGGTVSRIASNSGSSVESSPSSSLRDRPLRALQ